MIDAEVFLAMLFERDIAEALEVGEALDVSPDIDAGELQNLPALFWAINGDGQVANGDGLWTYTLTCNLFGEGMDQAKKFARIVYDVAHFWGERPDLTVIDVPDAGNTWVHEIDDVDVFSRLASADIDGRNVTQYVGSFALALRNN